MSFSACFSCLKCRVHCWQLWVLCSGQADDMGWIPAKDGGSGGQGTGPLAVSPHSAVSTAWSPCAW